MPELMHLAILRGSLSEEVTSSSFFKWWINQKVDAPCWIKCEHRSPIRDRAMEAFLKSKGLGPNGRAFIMATKFSSLNNGFININPETSLRDFLDNLKKVFVGPCEPMPLLVEMLKSCNTPVKEITGEMTIDNQISVEECMEMIVRLNAKA